MIDPCLTQLIRGFGALKVTKGEKAAVLPPTDTIYSKGTFSDAEFVEWLEKERRKLLSEGKPLFRYDTDAYREKPMRELMAEGKLP